MDSKELTIFIPAMRVIGNILVTDDPRIIDKAIKYGLIDKLSQILDKKTSL